MSLTHLLHFLILTAAAFILCSCTTVATFAVLNESEKPIELIYTLPKISSSHRVTCPDDRLFRKPRVQAKGLIDELAYGRGTLNPVAEYKCDEASGEVTIQLAPGQAVSLFHLGGYSGHPTEENAKNYGYLEHSLATLRVRGQAGEMQFTGTQVTRDFEKTSNGLYVLVFRG